MKKATSIQPEFRYSSLELWEKMTEYTESVPPGKCTVDGLLGHLNLSNNEFEMYCQNHQFSEFCEYALDYIYFHQFNNKNGMFDANKALKAFQNLNN